MSDYETLPAREFRVGDLFRKYPGGCLYRAVLPPADGILVAVEVADARGRNELMAYQAALFYTNEKLVVCREDGTEVEKKKPTWPDLPPGTKFRFLSDAFRNDTTERRTYADRRDTKKSVGYVKRDEMICIVQSECRDDEVEAVGG